MVVPATPCRGLTSQTTYAYDTSLDGLRQQRIYHKPDTSGSDSWDSTFSYDANGRLTYANVRDGEPRNITYVTDAQGQVMRRAEDDGNGSTVDPWARYRNGDTHHFRRHGVSPARLR